MPRPSTSCGGRSGAIPGDFWLNLELARILFQVAESKTYHQQMRTVFKQMEPARTLSQEDLTRWGEVVRFLTAASALYSENSPVHYLLGIALDIKGDHEEAIAESKKRSGLNPNDAMAHVAFASSLWGVKCKASPDLGTPVFLQGDPDGAIAEYREAIRLMPDDALHHSCLGILLLEKGELDEAIGEIPQGDPAQAR